MTATKPAAGASIALGAYLAAVVAVLLLPIDFQRLVLAIGDWLRAHLGTGWFGYGWVEFVANVVMFAPLGALLTIVLRHRWRGVALALALSVAAELVQVVLPSREPSVRDVVANSLGSAIGAATVWAFRSRIRPARRRRAGASRPTR